MISNVALKTVPFMR